MATKGNLSLVLQLVSLFPVLYMPRSVNLTKRIVEREEASSLERIWSIEKQKEARKPSGEGEV